MRQVAPAVGGVYNPSAPTVNSGDAAPLQVNPAGVLRVQLTGNDFAQIPAVGGPNDGVANPTGLFTTASIQVFNGASWAQARTPAVFKPLDALAIGAEATVWTPASGKKFRLMGAVLAASAAVTVKLRDNTAGPVIREVLLEASKSLVLPFEGNGTLSAAADNVLTAAGSAAANLTGYVFGTEE